MTAESAISALAADDVIALILAEAADDRPTGVDAGRLANRMCDAAGISADHRERLGGYQHALARLAKVAAEMPNARYVTGMT